MKVELTKKCSNKTHAFTQTAIGTKKYVRFSFIQSSTKIRKIYLEIQWTAKVCSLEM